MTKKDYLRIASAFYSALDEADSPEKYAMWMEMVESMSRVLQDDNPRFIRSSFLKACESGVTGKV